MDRQRFNLGLNATLFVAALGLTFTGLLLEFALEGRGSTWLGISRGDWSEVHFVLALTVVAAVLLHLWLHRDWIVATVTGGTQAAPSRRRLGQLLSTLALLLTLGALILPLVVEGQGGGWGGGWGGGQGYGQGHGRGHHHGVAWQERWGD